MKLLILLLLLIVGGAAKAQETVALRGTDYRVVHYGDTLKIGGQTIVFDGRSPDAKQWLLLQIIQRQDLRIDSLHAQVEELRLAAHIPKR